MPTKTISGVGSARTKSSPLHADLPLGTTDASVVALAERLGVDEVAAPGRRHICVVRLRHVDVLNLLPGQRVVQGRSLSGFRTAQMCLIRSPAMSNASTASVRPFC